MTLTEFLLARIAEDEAVARDAAEVPPIHSSRWQLSTVKVETIDGVTHTRPRGTVEARPARVLADVEAKRAIVELHRTVGYEDAEMNEVGTGCYTCGFGDDPCETLCALALPYADHESFDESWRP